MTCLKALRDAAMVETNPTKQREMLLAANNLFDAVQEFCRNQSWENMVGLNAMWIQAKVALDLATPSRPPPGTPSTVPEAARLADRKVA